MNSIILDSYYLISLHQDRFKEINTIRLTNLLYLLEGYYMCIYDEEYLYKEKFNLNLVRNI